MGLLATEMRPFGKPSGTQIHVQDHEENES